MKQIRIAGRLWNIAKEMDFLLPWAEKNGQFDGTPVKKNSKRSVWKLRNQTGGFCFVKIEYKHRLPFTVSKAEREFRAFELLSRKQIPCAEYIGWSATLKDSIIVSKALPDTFIPVLEYWFRQPEASLEFLHLLCDFIAGVCRAGIFHPDFHMGNLMTDGKQIVLIDPIGIREVPATDSPCPGMLAPLNELFGDFPLEVIGEELLRSGLYSGKEAALEILRRTEQKKQDLITHEWEKRKKQILSGSSKFAVKLDSGIMRRNSAWFAPIAVPEGAALKEYEFSPEEGQAYWLSSFEDQLRRKKREEIPVFFKFAEGKVKITVVSDKKYTFFYGFR